MRILFVVSEDWYFWTHRFDLAKYGIKKGYKIALLSQFSKHEMEISEAKIRTYPWSIDRSSTNIIKNLSPILGIYNAIKDFKPDLIHSVAMKPIIFSYYIGKFLGVKKFVFALEGLELCSQNLLSKVNAQLG